MQTWQKLKRNSTIMRMHNKRTWFGLEEGNESSLNKSPELRSYRKLKVNRWEGAKKISLSESNMCILITLNWNNVGWICGFPFFVCDHVDWWFCVIIEQENLKNTFWLSKKNFYNMKIFMRKWCLLYLPKPITN